MIPLPHDFVTVVLLAGGCGCFGAAIFVVIITGYVAGLDKRISRLTKELGEFHDRVNEVENWAQDHSMDDHLWDE
jgi:hypothetical protein